MKKISSLFVAFVILPLLAHAQYMDSPFGQMDASYYYNQLQWSQPDAVQNYVNGQIDTLGDALKVDLEISFYAGAVISGAEIADAAIAGILGLEVLGDAGLDFGVHAAIDWVAEHTIDPLTDWMHEQANDYFLDLKIEEAIQNSPTYDFPDSVGNIANEA